MPASPLCACVQYWSACLVYNTNLIPFPRVSSRCITPSLRWWGWYVPQTSSTDYPQGPSDTVGAFNMTNFKEVRKRGRSENHASSRDTTKYRVHTDRTATPGMFGAAALVAVRSVRCLLRSSPKNYDDRIHMWIGKLFVAFLPSVPTFSLCVHPDRTPSRSPTHVGT